LPDGSSVYLRKEVLKFLPNEELSYWCIVARDSIRAVLVEDANNEVIAIFAEIVPHSPLKEEQ
jgi:hypothetical protein